MTCFKENVALLHFRTRPPFLLMILVQNFMLIKNLIESWVWKSTETKLFTSKVLKNLEVTMKKRYGLNTTILSPCWKINKLSRMKVKSKSHHEATGIEHHHSLTMLKTRRRKIFEKQWCFYALFVQRRPGSHMRSRILSAKTSPFHSQEKSFLKKSA